MTAQMATRLTLRTFKHKKRKVSNSLNETEISHRPPFLLSIYLNEISNIKATLYFTLIVSTDISTITESTTSTGATAEVHTSTTEDKKTAAKLSKSLLGKETYTIGSMVSSKQNQ